MGELKTGSIPLGTVIAFIAPGFLAFKAAAYHATMANDWLATASNKDQSVGVFLFVLLGSLALGIAVSGVRAFAIDRLLCSKNLLRRFAINRVPIDWSKVDEKKLVILNDLVDSHYRYYQFYANTLVALILLLVSYLFSPNAKAWPYGYWIVFTLIGLALLWSAYDAFSRYCNGTRLLLAGTGEQKPQ